MKPLTYGYLRRLPEVDDAMERRLIAELATFAGCEGFTLALVFIEKQWQHTAALNALTVRCRTDGVRSVIVPTLEHLNTLPVLGLMAQMALQEDIGGQVWIVATESEESSCAPTHSPDGGHQ